MSEAFYTDKKAVQAAFDRAAQSYDAAAVLQREVADRMLERLALMRIEPVRVLDAGCGTGYALPGLRQRFGSAELLALDLAPGMLRVVQQKQSGFRQLFGLLDRQKALPLCGDIEALPLADASVDVIWSSLTLQWCNTPDRAFAEFRRVLRPGGLLLFATLGPDTLHELRTAFAGVDGYSHVNQFIDMHDLGDALGQQGFSGPVMDMEYLTLTYPDARAVMRDLKDIGAANHMHGRRSGMMGRAAWQRVVAQYEALRRDGVLPCTYEVIYGHAWKTDAPASRTLADGAQIIEFRPRK
ncbi:malonyl-ACP O-methyltransferase BioC [Chitinilyticum piscinae]|uniref:Malonyl-[acyl-carrier protein] O-methyltransferase n=1 Tax=Chitinilyticum piscinae TaxID=2866724 RepID=A0A8J7KBD7_9NEIS|nr:malonyl-ACP O-methyltransferase BioC [Chitinilyticum piscinae]MBE9610129.1 malonyl-ACP O-methyltransferase BioC [Chitinilyticum piscinae]